MNKNFLKYLEDNQYNPTDTHKHILDNHELEDNSENYEHYAKELGISKKEPILEDKKESVSEEPKTEINTEAPIENKTEEIKEPSKEEEKLPEFVGETPKTPEELEYRLDDIKEDIKDVEPTLEKELGEYNKIVESLEDTAKYFDELLKQKGEDK